MSLRRHSMAGLIPPKVAPNPDPDPDGPPGGGTNLEHGGAFALWNVPFEEAAVPLYGSISDPDVELIADMDYGLLLGYPAGSLAAAGAQISMPGDGMRIWVYEVETNSSGIVDTKGAALGATEMTDLEFTTLATASPQYKVSGLVVDEGAGQRLKASWFTSTSGDYSESASVALSDLSPNAHYWVRAAESSLGLVVGIYDSDPGISADPLGSPHAEVIAGAPFSDVRSMGLNLVSASIFSGPGGATGLYGLQWNHRSDPNSVEFNPDMNPSGPSASFASLPSTIPDTNSNFIQRVAGMNASGSYIAYPGSSASGSLNKILVFNTATQAWTQYDHIAGYDTGYSWAFGVAWADDLIAFFPKKGGFPSSTHPIELFDPITGVWTNGPTVTYYGPRMMLFSVTENSVVWGSLKQDSSVMPGTPQDQFVYHMDIDTGVVTTLTSDFLGYGYLGAVKNAENGDHIFITGDDTAPRHTKVVRVRTDLVVEVTDIPFTDMAFGSRNNFAPSAVEPTITEEFGGIDTSYANRRTRVINYQTGTLVSDVTEPNFRPTGFFEISVDKALPNGLFLRMFVQSEWLYANGDMSFFLPTGEAGIEWYQSPEFAEYSRAFILRDGQYVEMSRAGREVAIAYIYEDVARRFAAHSGDILLYSETDGTAGSGKIVGPLDGDFWIWTTLGKFAIDM